MPITSTTRKAGPFLCNGVQTVFPFAFKVFEATDVRVVLANATGIESDVAAVIALNSDQDTNPGGTVTVPTAYASGNKITIASNIPQTQEAEFVNQGGFYPELLNEGLDRAVALIQQVDDKTARSIKLPVSAAEGEYTLPVPQGNQLLAWNSDGTGVINLNPGDLVSVATYGNTRADKFDGDGVDTTFTLSGSPGSVNNLAISIDGVVQVPEVDYIWGGGTALIFTVAPPNGTKIFVRYQEALDEGTDVSGKLDRAGGNASFAILNNLPYLAPAPSAAVRSVADRFAEVLSVNDFSDPAPGNKFGNAQLAAGEQGTLIDVAPGDYDLSYPLGGQNTWLLRGPTTFTGAGATQGPPGKVLQLSGVTNPGGAIAFSNPVYLGKWDKSWVTSFTTLTGRVSPLSTANFAVQAAAGNTGVYGGSRSSDNAQPGYDEGGIGGFFMCDNDRASPQKGMYAVYIDAIRRSGAGTTHGIELDSINMGSVVQLAPNNPFIDGLTSGLWVAAGGGVTGAQTSSAAVTILNNGARWDKGILFHEIALADRGDGSGEAIAFGFKHYLAQYNTSGTVCNRIHFNSTTTTNGQQIFLDGNGFSILDITSGASRFNVNSAGFSFGPGGAQWMSYALTGNIFQLGHPTDPIIYATPTGVALTKTTTIGGPGGGGYSLLATNIPSAVNFIEVQGATASNGPLIRAAGTDAVAWLRLQGKSTAGVQLLLSQVASAADDAAAATALVPVGGIYRTASTLKVRTA